MKGADEVTATTRGTRPGDPVANVLFNIAFRLVVLDARAKFGQASDLSFVGDQTPIDNILEPPILPREGFAEVSFVDDMAYVMHARCPAKLVASLQLVASCLHDAAAGRGLLVNYSAGKTEAMLRLAGSGSKLVRHEVWHQLGGKLPVVTEHGSQFLRLVHAYKHLGTFMEDHAVVNKDMNLRVSQAKKAFGQLRRSFYAKRNVYESTKVRVFEQLVCSRHSYNVHTWSWWNERDETKWRDGIKELVACLARNKIRPIPAYKFSTDECHPWPTRTCQACEKFPTAEPVGFQSLGLGLGPGDLQPSKSGMEPWNWNPGTLEPWNPGTLESWNPGTLEPWNPGTLEPWNAGTLEPWNPEPWNPGTLEPWTLEPWNPGTLDLGTLEPCNPGTLEPWNPGTLESWNPETLKPGTLEPWKPGTLEPWNLGTLGPWNPGTLKPWNPGTLNLGTLEPWNPGTLEPWNPETLEPRNSGPEP